MMIVFLTHLGVANHSPKICGWIAYTYMCLGKKKLDCPNSRTNEEWDLSLGDIGSPN
jgi:hypothetical protein